MAKGKLCQNNLLEVKFTKKNGIKSVIKPKRNLSPKNERVSFEKKKSVYHSFKLLSEKFEFVRWHYFESFSGLNKKFVILFEIVKHFLVNVIWQLSNYVKLCFFCYFYLWYVFLICSYVFDTMLCVLEVSLNNDTEVDDAIK